MIPIVTKHGGYRRTLTFGYVCLVYHATEVFCERNFSYKNDPLGKTVGQMVGAARSARQNIVEGSSRAGTSKETELRLYDVAKGSLEVLAGDYEAYLAGRGIVPWAASSSESLRLKALKIDPYGGDLGENARHDYVQYILEMRRRFTELLSAARLEKRDAQIQADGAPKCPLCGKPMRKMVAKKGRNAGNAFWSCTGYPDCKGTRSWT